MSDVTKLLESAAGGDADSLNQLYEQVYAELRAIAGRKMASERPGHTLQPTALVHEAYLRLGGAEGFKFENRAHFFAAAAEAMRRILVDSARRHGQVKRGGDLERVELYEAQIAAPVEDEKLLLVNEALDALAREDPLQAEVAKMRYFVGLKHQEIADALGRQRDNGSPPLGRGQSQAVRADCRAIRPAGKPGSTMSSFSGLRPGTLCAQPGASAMILSFADRFRSPTAHVTAGTVMKDLDSIYFTARELPPEDRPPTSPGPAGAITNCGRAWSRCWPLSAEAEAFVTDLPDDEAEEAEPGRGMAKTLKPDLADAPDEVIGQKIGRYKLLERIGEGGCGVVYVAEQTEPVRRRVALKVIKLGMDTKQVIARFEAERQALAMMDHPNIAKVLDAGTTELGRPYFVMELVRGIRITDYCDQANLTTKERLDLFIKVCQAIQHAHQKGIIHRDIKPSNILVTLHDGVPVPKVIDFGIAKATEGRLTDKTVYTQLHQFIGTPAYMSPEQAEMSGLDIDTRSDIYSLGVLLYELLTGSTPFDAKELMASGLDAMRQTIREKEPPRPSTRLATLRRRSTHHHGQAPFGRHARSCCTSSRAIWTGS